MLFKIENSADLVRDSSSRAIINTNNESYKRAIESKAKRMSTENRLTVIEQQIISMKDDITSILSLLKQRG